MNNPRFKFPSGFGIKARLLLAFGIMVTLTVLIGSVGWWGIINIQRSLDILQRESLPQIARALQLAEQSASLEVQASLIANARILFHLDEEGAALKEKLKAFSTLVQELEVEENEPGFHLMATVKPPGLRLGNLARRIEDTLLELIEATREGIFLLARMRDRQYKLTSTYGALENVLSEQIHRFEDSPLTTPADAGPRDMSVETVSQSPLLMGLLGETHRIAGALIAAETVENLEALNELETRYQWGRLLLRSKLEQLEVTLLPTTVTTLTDTLLELGRGEKGIFELRRRQLGNDDRQAYLLTVSNVLSVALNDQVARFINRVEAVTEASSRDASAVLNVSKARIILLGIACLVAAIVSAWYVVRDLGGNLAAVTHSMTMLAGGDRSIQVPGMTRRDEIGHLARAFDVFKENMFKLDETSQQLMENNKLLAAIFNNINDGLSVIDGKGRLIAWNPRFLDLYDLSENSIKVGMPIATLNADLIGRGMEIRSIEGRLLTREAFNQVHQLSRQRVEESLPDGRLIELRSSPMPTGEVVTVYTDLTERKAIEAQLRQAQKMESVGQLTGGLAHDFNNLLAAIIGNLSLLQEELIGQDRQRKKALRALEVAERGVTITRRLLAFSRKQILQPQRVDCNALIEAMLDLLDYSLGEAITVELQLQPDLWSVMIDPGQLENALMNLALNSRDATPDGGQLFIQTENWRLDEVAAQRHGAKSGDYVTISVQDTGSGMSEEVLNHVFEPFFTTKKMGAGSGLGLSMVYGFIKQSGGYIRIESAPARGTRIFLYLPKAVAENHGIPPSPSLRSIPFEPRDMRVLVVEDDAGVRQIAVDMLASLGYRTLEAGDGEAALKLLDDNVALLFTDVMLPHDLNGPAIVRQVLQRYPHLKVLYCSAWARDRLVEDGYLESGVEFIQKPYSIEGLARKLRIVLEVE